MSEQKHPASLPFALFALLAIAVGVYARFKGLGFAPIGVDEYYLSRAVDNILRFGFPTYDCGGLYQRGIGLQYLIAGLRLAGLSAELAPRLIAAVTSLMVLPAVFLIARRLISTNSALVVIGLIALSLWEVEMARFGRFYSPFQAIFCWYVVYFLKFTVDRDTRSWRGMLILTAVATFVWEGAIFLALANFVPLLIALADSDKIQKDEWLSAALSVPLLVGTYFLGTFYFGQFFESMPQHPDGYTGEILAAPASKLQALSLEPVAFTPNPLSISVVLLLLVASALALKWVWQWRHRPLAALGLLGILAAAWAQEFTIVVAIALLLALLQQLPLSELRRQGVVSYVGALLAVCLSAFAYRFVHLDWQALVLESGGASRALAVFLYQFFSFPDVLVEIVRPFVATVPWLSLMLGLGIGTALISQIGATPFRSPQRMLLILMLLLALGIGLSGPPRHETRYSYFLYPLAVVVATMAVYGLIARCRLRQRTGEAVAAIITLALFTLTEDFNGRHLLTVDSRASTFRVGVDPLLEAHLGEARADFRLIAQWLNHRVDGRRDVVVNAVHGLDYYYQGTNYFYTDYAGFNFKMWSCRKGAVDRWTNHPLIYTIADLKDKADKARLTYLVTWTDEAKNWLPLLENYSPSVALTDGFVTIIALKQGKD